MFSEAAGKSHPQHTESTSRADDVTEENSPAPPPADSAQPSLLSALLARRKSAVRVPAASEVSSPVRGSGRPLDRLPYLPHSPFFLFSYDVEEEKAQEKSRWHHLSHNATLCTAVTRVTGLKNITASWWMFLSTLVSRFTFVCFLFKWKQRIMGIETKYVLCDFVTFWDWKWSSSLWF